MEAKRKEFLKSSLTVVPFLKLLLPIICLHTIAKTPQWGCGRGQEVRGNFKLVLTVLLLPHASLLFAPIWVFLASCYYCLLARGVLFVCMCVHGMMRLNRWLMSKTSTETP